MTSHDPLYGSDGHKKLMEGITQGDQERARQITSLESFHILGLLPIECWNGEPQRSSHPYKRNIIGCQTGSGVAQWEDEYGQIYFLASSNSVLRIHYRLEIYDDGSTQMIPEKTSAIKAIGGKGVVNALYNEVLKKYGEQASAEKIQKSFRQMMDNQKKEYLSMFQMWGDNVYA